MPGILRFGGALAATLVLLAPAIWNRFPLLQYDTGGYLARWYEGYLVPSRSTVYGLFLMLLSWAEAPAGDFTLFDGAAPTRTGEVVLDASTARTAGLAIGDDVAASVEAALTAPSGVFNVGAEPVRRQLLVDGYAAAVGQSKGGFVRSWVAGRRLEPLTRSLRVSSSSFNRETGWAPRRPEFDLSWLTAARPVPAGTR